MTDPLFTRLLIATLTAALVVICVFGAAPGLDLAVSAAFTDGAGQFTLAQGWLAGTVNAVLKRTLEIWALVCVLIAGAALIWRARPASGLRNWLFLAGSYLAGPGLIVNMILKEHFGRARPVQTTVFGGELQFTPVLQITDQCLSNCSFTSGETAMSGAAAFTLAALMWRGDALRRGWVVAGATALTGFTIYMRVALGRHFASDALLSVCIVALVVLALYRLLGIGAARADFTAAALATDARALRGRLGALGAGLWARLPDQVRTRLAQAISRLTRRP